MGVAIYYRVEKGRRGERLECSRYDVGTLVRRGRLAESGDGRGARERVVRLHVARDASS